MLSSGKESAISSAGTSDREDASKMMEIDAKIVTAQGGAADHSSREVQATKPNSSIN